MQTVPEGHIISDEVVSLASLFVTSDVLRGVSFVNCTIVGPAVVVLLGESSLQHTALAAAGPDAFWPYPDDRQFLVGVLGLVDCHISRCQLQRIGLAVPQSRLEETKRGFGL